MYDKSKNNQINQVLLGKTVFSYQKIVCLADSPEEGVFILGGKCEYSRIEKRIRRAG